MTATAGESSSKGSKASVEEATGHMLVVDLGKASGSRVRKLRKGGGRLMQDVADAVAELRRSAALPEHSHPVVVVVERKRKRRRRLPFGW